MINWYTADLHFGHENIIKLCNRPFDSLEQMDTILMENMHARVGPEDRLWIIGDFVYGRKSKNRKWLNELFEQLPGAEQHLIIGNHDLASTQKLPWTNIDNHGPAPTLELSWTSISHMAEVRDGPKNQVHTLCHYPLLTWNHARRDALQIFGHVHNNWQGSRNCVNAGVDVWDYAPVRFEELEARARVLPVNKYWQDVEPGHLSEEQDHDSPEKYSASRFETELIDREFKMKINQWRMLFSKVCWMNILILFEIEVSRIQYQFLKMFMKPQWENVRHSHSSPSRSN